MVSLRNTHADHLLSLRDSGERARQEILEERSQQQERAKVALANIAIDLEAELKQIDADKAARLRDAGIDDQESRRLKRELDELDERIKAVNDRRSEIERYQHWLAKILPELPRPSGIRNGLQGDQDRLGREAHSQEREVEQARAHILDRRKALTEWDRLDREQQRVLQNAFGRLSFLNDIDEEAWNASLTAADIEDEVNQLLRQRTDLGKQGRAQYSSIHSRFHQESLLHTPQEAAIEQIVSQARNAAHETETAWIEGAAGLLEYIEVSHPDQKIKLIVQARNLSDELCDSRGKLETLHKSIQRLGRDATAKASEVLGAFAQIRQFEFRVTSRIHSLTFWDDLTFYEQQYRRWMMMGEGYLPTDGFIEALRRLERQIAEGAFTSKFSDCFDVSVSCNDQGRTKVATNNAELVGISSTGVTKIIVAMIYVSLFELLRQDADFQMSVPIDEALELSAENYVALVDYFNSRGISMLAGFPGGAPELLRQFPNRYTLERRPNADAIIVKEYGIDADDVLDDLNAALGMDEEELML